MCAGQHAAALRSCTTPLVRTCTSTCICSSWFSALKKSKRTAIDQLLSDDDDSDAEMFDDIDEMEEENETKVSILCPGHK